MALLSGLPLRPCTGALFVLVIAAGFDVFVAGGLSVLKMGLGAAAAHADSIAVLREGQMEEAFSALDFFRAPRSGIDQILGSDVVAPGALVRRAA